MTEYVTGQIYGWNGGECPVHPKTKIKVWTRNGNTSDEGGCGAEHYLWRHHNSIGDIVCFQVVTPYVEPKVIYVNEHIDGAHIAHASEENAKRWGGKHHTRVAVKYVEVKECFMGFDRMGDVKDAIAALPAVDPAAIPALQARIEELVKERDDLGRKLNTARYGQPDFAWSIHEEAMADLRAKLTKAVDALRGILKGDDMYPWRIAREVLAELEKK